MNGQNPGSKNKKWTTWLFYSVVFIWMAGATAWSVIVTSRLVHAELQLGTYVNLAGKAHAGLNFYRGRIHLLRPEGEQMEAAATNGYLYKEFPAYSKWDKLYQETYNEQMRAHLATNSPPAKQR